MTAFIEINGQELHELPFSQFIIKFFEALGVEGIMFITILFMFYLFVCILQDSLKRDKQREKEKKSNRMQKFYDKKLEEAKTKKDFNKLEEWREKNKEILSYGRYY